MAGVKEVQRRHLFETGVRSRDRTPAGGVETQEGCWIGERPRRFGVKTERSLVWTGGRGMKEEGKHQPGAQKESWSLESRGPGRGEGTLKKSTVREIKQP